MNYTRDRLHSETTQVTRPLLINSGNINDTFENSLTVSIATLISYRSSSYSYSYIFCNFHLTLCFLGPNPKGWGHTREHLCIFTYVQIEQISKVRFCIELFKIQYSCFEHTLICTYIIILVENYCGKIFNLRNMILLICT